MLKTTTATAILGVAALLTAGCGGDSGTDTSTASAEVSPAPAQSEPITIPVQDWAKQVDALCAAEVSEVSKINEPDTSDSAAVAEYLAQVKTLVAQLSADITAVGVPDQNAGKAAKLAGYFAQSAAILEGVGPDSDIDALMTEISQFTPKMDALAKELNAPSCAS